MPLSLNALEAGDKIRIIKNSKPRRKRRESLEPENGGVDNVRPFHHERLSAPFNIVAITEDGRYMVINKTRRPSAKFPICIIDREKGKFGTHNRGHNHYDLNNREDVQQLVKDVEAGSTRLYKHKRQIRPFDDAGPNPPGTTGKKYRWQKHDTSNLY